MPIKLEDVNLSNVALSPLAYSVRSAVQSHKGATRANPDVWKMKVLLRYVPLWIAFSTGRTTQKLLPTGLILEYQMELCSFESPLWQRLGAGTGAGISTCQQTVPQLYICEVFHKM